VIFVVYLAQLQNPLNSITWYYQTLNTCLVESEALLKLLDEHVDVQDKPGAPDLVVSNAEIEFDNVSFSYESRGPALRGVSFKIPQGSSVALVGESGAGKSTVMRLLYRFFDLKEGQGRILIDGQDIREVTQESLRRYLGVVPQEPVLFNDTIGYNIGYGKRSATQAEIEEAARAAQIHDRIMALPDRYETKVGERGVQLSGGEKQRVAIARTILKNPPILLLDEATSSLDSSTERDIQGALQNLVKGRSTLSIAHRLTTIAAADMILVMQDGTIVERGTHAELLGLNGVFARMWTTQMADFSGPPSPTIERPSKEVPDFVLPREPTGYSVVEVQTVDVPPEVPAKDALNEDAPAPSEPEPVPVSDGPSSSEPFPSAPPLSDDLPAEDVPGPSSEPAKQDEQTASYAEVAAATPDPDAPVVDQDPASVPPASPARDSGAGLVNFPVSFPTSGDDESMKAPSSTGAGSTSHTPGPSVTFGASVDTPPSHSRTGTPEPASEGKRKRTTSQNLQRLARRVSLVSKRSGSVSSIPNPFRRKEEKKEGEASPRPSRDGEGSSSNGSQLKGDNGKGDKTKGKKS